MQRGLSTRGCDATYRGWLSAEPRKMQRELGGEMMAARMGVNMAASDVPAEQKDELTEWVNVLVFSPKLMARLEKAEKGGLITVIGSVDKKWWESQTGERRIDRTIIADDLLLASDARPMPESGAEELPEIPGAMPRGCDATYRGYLTDEPKTVTRDDGTEMTQGRIGVHMSPAEMPDEHREELTEWVNVKVFEPGQRRRLARCRKGELIAVTGNVTKRNYHTATGDLRIDRTIMADHVLPRSVGRSEPAAAKRERRRTDERPPGTRRDRGAPGIAAAESGRPRRAPEPLPGHAAASETRAQRQDPATAAREPPKGRPGAGRQQPQRGRHRTRAPGTC